MFFTLTMALAIAAEVQAEPPGAERDGAVGIVGTVVDRDSGEPIEGATVTVVSGPGSRGAVAMTTSGGRFLLRVIPGRYAIVAMADWHRPVRIKNITVDDGRRTSVRVALPPDPDATEVVYIDARADKRKETVLLETRKRAGAVSDAVGAQEMSRSADSSAGDALKRVVSLTLVDGKFVTIRGLGGRYTTTLLNGVVLPSPDPDDGAVPLDLFPSALLSNLTVMKTFSPELPGTFAGGAVQIETSTYPDAFEAKVKLGLGFDTASVFKAMPSYEGGTADALGFDDGSRDLPAGLPANTPLAGAADGLSASELERIGEAFPNVWAARDGTAWPNLSLGATVGDTVGLGPSGKLGYLTSLTLSHQDRLRDSVVRKLKLDGGEVVLREETDVLTGTESASLGALVSLGYQPSAAHDLGLFVLYTHQGDKSAQLASGYSESDASDATSTRLQFITRELAFGQLRGAHRIDVALGLQLGWNANVSFAAREEPDTRDTAALVLDDGRSRFDAGPGSGERFFSRVEDLGTSGAFTFGLPLTGVRIDGGASAQASFKTYGARRFRYDLVGRDPAVLFLPIEEMLGPEHIGPDFEIGERTNASDGYDATAWTAAGHLGLDVTAGAPVRVLAGVRFEAAGQVLDPGTPYAVNQDDPAPVDRLDLDWLPSAAVVVALSDEMNLRAAYGWTLARPQTREIAPILYYDFVRRRSVSGNPELTLTRIHNADLRWEWFWGQGALVSVSAFFKHFDDPIERVIVSAANGNISFDNAPSAWVVGGELEARTDFGFISPALKPLRLTTNVTLLKSEVTTSGERVSLQTSSSRPLQGQSPYVVNVGLGWEQPGLGFEVGLYYNVTGPRIAEVGFDGLPDVYETAFHRLDLTASQALPAGFKLKLAASNLAYQSARFEADGIAVYEVEPGVSVSLSLEWSSEAK